MLLLISLTSSIAERPTTGLGKVESDIGLPCQPSGQRIMPKTRFTSFPALSVYPMIGISLSESETDVRFYFSQTGGRSLSNHTRK